MSQIALLKLLAYFRGSPSEGKEGVCDFVSRFFTPQCSIFEDPVTGSSFCSLAPYWARKLGKRRLRAKQVSSFLPLDTTALMNYCFVGPKTLSKS